jgi:hypothetical protein
MHDAGVLEETQFRKYKLDRDLAAAATQAAATSKSPDKLPR